MSLLTYNQNQIQCDKQTACEQESNLNPSGTGVKKTQKDIERVIKPSKKFDRVANGTPTKLWLIRKGNGNICLIDQKRFNVYPLLCIHIPNWSVFTYSFDFIN